MEYKIEQIEEIYQTFEREVQPYARQAVCARGCAFCCTDAGRIDVTTLEGLRIQRKIDALTRPQQVALNKAITSERRKRQKQQAASCPFLQKNKACMIYAARPFACRRLYSLRVCNRENPPMLNRHVFEIAGRTIRQLQELDDTGYTGHLTDILFMLQNPAFRDTYLDGAYKPEEVMAFGKTHQIVINRIITRGMQSS